MVQEEQKIEVKLLLLLFLIFLQTIHVQEKM